MERDQIDQYDMILSTEKTLKDNLALFAAGSPILTSKAALDTKINELARHIAIQLINPTGITVDKNHARDALETQAFVLGAACCSYASANNKGELYARCHYTKTDLGRFRDAELVGICTNLLGDLIANSASLVPYSVTTIMVSNFQSSINAFSNIMKLPTEGIAKRTAATAKIAVLLPQLITFLEERLDNDVIAYTSTQPNFVAIYQTVRLINSSPTTRLSLTVTLLENGSKMAIPNVDVEIVGENITRRSSDRGYTTVLNLVSGVHTIKASHPNYETLVQDFTIVSGETTELVLLLTRL